MPDSWSGTSKVRTLCVALAAAAALAFLFGGPSAAAAGAATMSVSRLVPGKEAQLKIVVPAVESGCEVAATTKRLRLPLAQLASIAQPNLKLAWVVPRAAKRAWWHFALICEDQLLAASRNQVTGAIHGRLVIVRSQAQRVEWGMFPTKSTQNSGELASPPYQSIRISPALNLTPQIQGTTGQVPTTPTLPVPIVPGEVAPYEPTPTETGSGCTSPSSTGTEPSEYNTTPEGPGPWEVPLDPCNTEGQGLSDFYENCAYWGAEKRPDVWVNAVWRFGYPEGDGAWAIKLDAEQANYPIDHSPQPGDLVAWQGGHEMGKGVGGYATGGTFIAGGPHGEGGHVAFVEKVDRPGVITISEMGSFGVHGGTTSELEYNEEASWFIHSL